MTWMPAVYPFRSIARFSGVTLAILLLIGCIARSSAAQNHQHVNEDVASVTFMILERGWETNNHSEPVNAAVPGWSQCSGGHIAPAQAGSPESCAQVGWTSIAPDTHGVISNWLFGPNITIANGDRLSFWTRTVAGNFWGDRLQVRLSTNGASTDIGTRAEDVGDFTTLLLDISPTYQVGQYPEVWTKYTITMEGLTAPANGRFAFRYFIEDGGATGNVGYIVGVDSVEYTAINTPFDYDNDGHSDFSVFRPSTGAWYLLQSTAGFFGTGFGSDGDRIVPADYDGDGKVDIAVFRPSTGVWYIIKSSNGTVMYVPFGISEDKPAAADYDGDGKADVCIFRPSIGTFYRLNSSNGAVVAAQFGQNGDKPTVGDFDGDFKADIGIFRPSAGAWYQTFSSNGTFFGEQFGVGTDKIVPADYDGDGKTDIAIYRGSESLWYVKRSGSGEYVPYVFGLATDIPVPSDFDGDGKADIGVFRPSDGTWYVINSTNGSFTISQFGQNGDVPTHSAYGGN